MLANPKGGGDLHRRHDDVRLAETLFPVFMPYEVAAVIRADEADDQDDVYDDDESDCYVEPTDEQFRQAARKAAGRAIDAAVQFRLMAEAHLDAPGYRAAG